MRKGRGLSWWKTAPEFQPDPSLRLAGSGQEDALAAQLSTSLVTWQASGWLSPTCVPDQAHSLGDASQKEKTWKVSRARPCSCPLCCHCICPNLQPWAAAPCPSLAVPAAGSQTSPATIWLFRRNNKRQLFLFLCLWACTYSLILESGPLYILHFCVFCTFLVSTNAISFGLQLSH